MSCSTPSVAVQVFNDFSVREKENIPPYSIDPLIITKYRVGCLSRRNLAGRLASVAEEKKSSNCCGVRGKKQLDPSQLKAIKLASDINFERNQDQY